MDQILIQKKLAETYSALKAKNPSFSLRSFAKRIHTNPSAISEILQGKRRVSKKLAEKILDRIAINPAEKAEILNSFETLIEKKKTVPVSHLQATALTLDQFNLISNWHHFAILSLVETSKFKNDSMWIARRLGLRPQEVDNAIERLLRIGLVKKTGKSLVLCQAAMKTPDEVASSALKNSHRQNLALAEKSLEEDMISKRDFTATTMAIDPKKIPEAKRRIRLFQDELMEYLESGTKSEVYKVCVQMFPLTKQKGDL